MPRRSVRNVFLLGVLVGLVVALVRAATRDTRPAPARPLVAPPAPLPAAARRPAPVVLAEEVVEVPVPLAETPPVSAGHDEGWVEPVDGACPAGYPIKAKVSSGIFHSPGGLSYDRTVPDRCYRDATSAEADGYRAAKR